MGLRDFEGQPELGKSLLFALSKGRLAHAYIFSGPQGSGKTRLSRALARAVLCSSAAASDQTRPGEADPEDRDSCGACQACLLVSQDSHPDVVVFRPEAGKTTYPIKQVREEIRRGAYLRPALGPKRFLIIEQAEALVRTTGSRNEVVDTLLKLLEEPAPNTVVILLATRTEPLPDTVLSRCQHLRLRPPGAGHVAEVVSAESDVDHEEAVFLAYLAGSDLTVARNLAGGRKKDRQETRALRQLLSTLTLTLGEMSYSELFATAAALEGYCRSGPVLGGALGVLALLYRDAAVLRLATESGVLSFEGGPEASLVRTLADKYDPALLRAMSLRALRAQEDSRRSPARLLLLEVFLLDLRSMLDGSPLPATPHTGEAGVGSLGVLLDE